VSVGGFFDVVKLLKLLREGREPEATKESQDQSP